MDDLTTRESSFKLPDAREGRGDRARRIGDIWQWLGMNGGFFGTGGVARRTFAYASLTAIVTVGVINIINVVTILHEDPGAGVAAPIIWEGSSWLSLVLLFWIPWLAYRAAPPQFGPRWKLLLHVPVAVAFSLAHVSGFVALRKLIYLLAGAHYTFGPFLLNFSYELRKDVLGYVLFVGGFVLIDHLLGQQQPAGEPPRTAMFDIRDGARITRVRLDDVLAITSAGNYVEFLLRDGRRLLMRSSLAAIGARLEPSGFLRTHRSWLVNASCMTALKPEGSGDYTVELGVLAAPLSRRFPEALARLRGP